MAARELNPLPICTPRFRARGSRQQIEDLSRRELRANAETDKRNCEMFCLLVLPVDLVNFVQRVSQFGQQKQIRSNDICRPPTLRELGQRTAQHSGVLGFAGAVLINGPSCAFVCFGRRAGVGGSFAWGGAQLSQWAESLRMKYSAELQLRADDEIETSSLRRPQIKAGQS